MSQEIIVGTSVFAAAALIGTFWTFKSRRSQEILDRFLSPKISYEEYPAAEKVKGARTVLVTGGNGFLGKYIVDMLIEKGLNAVVFDINIPHPKDHNSKITYIRGNLLDKGHLARAVAGADSVIHTASLIPFLGVPDKAIWAVNVTGAQQLLEEAHRQGVKSFVYTSSATVILSPSERMARKLTEDMKPTQHLDSYTATKYAAECDVLSFNGRKLAGGDKSMATTVLRPAAIFGAGDRNLTDIHVRGEDRIIIGHGNWFLDFVPVECVAHAHILAEEALSSSTESRQKVAGQVYNVGNDEEKTYGWFNGLGSVGEAPGLSHWQYPQPQNVPVNIIYTLAHINRFIFNVFGVQWMSPYLTPPIIDYTQRSYTYSIAKIRRDLGYKPLFTVSEAIERLVAKYRATKQKK